MKQTCKVSDVPNSTDYAYNQFQVNMTNILNMSNQLGALQKRMDDINARINFMNQSILRYQQLSNHFMEELENAD